MGTERVAGPFPAGFGGMSGRKDVKKQVQGSRRGRQKGGRAEQSAASNQQPAGCSKRWRYQESCGCVRSATDGVEERLPAEVWHK
jgi:membrane protease subunit (stomatin/prohibitin family)